MKRRIQGRSTPLEELLEPFFQSRPPLSERSSDEERAADAEWSKRMYAAAEAHGYTKLEVIRAGVFRQIMRPRPEPSKKRSTGRE